MIERLARSREHARWLLLGIAGVVLVVHSLAYNFVTDDAYISFVYSRNFAEHGELTFNLGDYVEGYTNFSWTVLLGVLIKIGISPELSSRVLGTACALGTLYVVMRTMERALGRKSAWAAVPPLLLACSSGFACWTSGGLETQLFTLLVAGALDGVVAAVERPAALSRAAICLALAAMTRPEGPLVAAVLGAVWIGHRVIVRRSEIAIATVTTTLPRRPQQILALACAGIFVGFLAGGVTLVARFGAFHAGTGLPWVLDVVIAGLAIGLPLFGLYDCLRIGRGEIRGLAAAGFALAALGIGTLAGAIKRGDALDEAVRWQHAIPSAVAAIALAATCLGLRVAIKSPWPRLRAELLATAWFLGLWLPWFLWRWWYYGHPFPNTYYVKASGEWSSPEFSSTMLGNGAYYVWRWLLDTRLLYASPVLLIGLAATRPKTPRFVLAIACAALAVIYLAYTITVGGDFMGLHRFIMPVFVVVAIAIVLGLEWLIGMVPEQTVVFPGSPVAVLAWVGIAVATIGFVLGAMPDDFPRQLVAGDLRIVIPVLVLVVVGVVLVVGRLRRTGLAIAAGCLLAGAFATSQAKLTMTSLDPKNLAADRGVIDTPAFLIVYTGDRAAIGKAMAPCFTDDDFSIVGGAGAQPYYGRMRGIDVFGLVSDKIAHREPRSRPRAGHTKWGSDSLLAEYNPDFIFSCYRIHRTPAQPQLPCAGYWLHKGFEEVTVKIDGMQEQGEYYTFLAATRRNFQCPIRIH